MGAPRADIPVGAGVRPAPPRWASPHKGGIRKQSLASCGSSGGDAQVGLGSANRRKWNRYPRKALRPARVSPSQPFRKQGNGLLRAVCAALPGQNPGTFHALLSALLPLEEWEATLLSAGDPAGGGRELRANAPLRYSLQKNLDIQAYSFNASCLKSSGKRAGLGH